MKNFFLVSLVSVIFLSACNTQLPQSDGEVSRLKQIDLVSSVPNYTHTTDDKLTDAWGLEFGHTGRVWLNNSSGFSTVYDGNGDIVMTKDAQGKPVPLAVKIPVHPGEEEAAPLTGMVFSDKDDFSGDSFVFVTEHGTIAGWHKLANGFEPLEATMRVDNSQSGAVYKGVTSAKTATGWRLYAANFAKNKVEIYDTKYTLMNFPGAFIDADLPKDYAAFNIKEITGELYVTYARQSIDQQNDIPGLGNGYISVFDTDGKFLRRFASNGQLNSPWGLALAPDDFGNLSGLLLVGNFGDGHIHAFDPENGGFVRTVMDEAGQPLQIDKLWALTFGTDNGAGAHNELFFAAGPSAEDQGLFGKFKLLP
jgi:uncharacterized protein (TIGR03118 family)